MNSQGHEARPDFQCISSSREATVLGVNAVKNGLPLPSRDRLNGVLHSHNGVCEMSVVQYRRKQVRCQAIGILLNVRHLPCKRRRGNLLDVCLQRKSDGQGSRSRIRKSECFVARLRESEVFRMYELVSWETRNLENQYDSLCFRLPSARLQFRPLNSSAQIGSEKGEVCSVHCAECKSIAKIAFHTHHVPLEQRKEKKMVKERTPRRAFAITKNETHELKKDDCWEAGIRAGRTSEACASCRDSQRAIMNRTPTSWSRKAKVDSLGNLAAKRNATSTLP